MEISDIKLMLSWLDQNLEVSEDLQNLPWNLKSAPYRAVYRKSVNLLKS